VEDEDVEAILKALFDIRRGVSRIVELLEEENGGEEGDEEP
jgi:hypothetical protein